MTDDITVSNALIITVKGKSNCCSINVLGGVGIKLHFVNIKGRLSPMCLAGLLAILQRRSRGELLQKIATCFPLDSSSISQL